MSDSSMTSPVALTAEQPSSKWGAAVFLMLLLSGVIYAGFSLYSDLHLIPSRPTMAYVLLGLALFIALGFEFVNGFHDTANAVATVIYTHSLQPNTAVVWSGLFNFLGVLTSSGAVAYGIISLLPVELVLHVGSNAGFAMIFSLLLAAIIWNLGTWWLGLPSSSSHTLIGSIIGVGVANQLMSAHAGTGGVDWHQVLNVGKALLFSPIIGFLLAGALLLLAKTLLPIAALYQPPKDQKAPPWPIRLLLVFTCTAVSFAHGSNDGQKGMGLIMLILIGTVPMAYALNHALPESELAQFSKTSLQAQRALHDLLPAGAALNHQLDPRVMVTELVEQKQGTPQQLAAVDQLIGQIALEVGQHENLKTVPADEVGNIRNDMYLTSESLRLIQNQQLQHNFRLNDANNQAISAYHQPLITPRNLSQIGLKWRLRWL
ncbi:inorganic phosphate transporter [Snodgrassella sp. CFCC 13594]|uniref:inorganic phosphate transporter n=1 Tax=Snodgrassella sp. CFCC 13594 TaxID=1775559 RepID=UPI0018D482C1|nr:inorganic phosphate transporter [Snodgrassella sp. CFCC 13594]